MLDKSKLFDLTGRVAIVTGGAGILGRGFCDILALYGAKVAVLDISEAAAKAAAAEISKNYQKCEVIGIGCNVSDPLSVKETVAQIISDLGNIDILHNNAASKSSSLSNFFEPLEEFKLETWREVTAVNLDGAFLMAQTVGSHMAENGGGSIIQTASIYGVVGPDQRIYDGSEYMGMQINTPAIYSATKAGLLGLTKYLATYWGQKNVRVNTLTPGGVESGQNDIFKNKYSARIPMGRMAHSDEMLGTLIFLASDASSYITGQNIIIDGGLTCW